jgi:drug/metabolite transporter (DMT)-like permease
MRRMSAAVARRTAQGKLMAAPHSPSLSPPPAAARPGTSVPWAWIGIALLAHTGWGAYPVMARYLQTISGLPSMSILSFGNLLALLVYAPFVIRRVDPQVFRQPILWLFAVVVTLRAITNLTSARFTLSVYVQLITQLAPLIVALLSAGLLKEKLPPFTWPAIGLSLLGGLMMMTADTAGIALSLSASDLLGISLAVASVIFLSIYMILVPRATNARVTAEVVLLIQLISLTVVTGTLSLLIGEDWSRYQALGWIDWTVFFSFVVFVLLGANLGQVTSLRRLGAPLVSSTMAWRLVAALLLGGLLLGEWLRTPLQLIGAVIVLVTITYYVSRQRKK